MLPIVALHEANLATGGIGGRALPAPQAGLMAQLAKGIVGGQMAWGLIGIGAAFGIALIMCGARSPDADRGGHVPAVRHGLRDLRGRRSEVGGGPDSPRGARRSCARKIEEKGTLLASGLIAGEAIVGILLAVTFLSGISSFTKLLTGADEFRFYPALGGWLSLAGFAAVAWVLVRIPMGHRGAK